MGSDKKEVVELDPEDSEDPYREAMEERKREEEAGSELPESPRLSEEYDENDEVGEGDGEYGYGWGHTEEGFDDPDTDGESGEWDEDERYARGLDDSDGD